MSTTQLINHAIGIARSKRYRMSDLPCVLDSKRYCMTGLPSRTLYYYSLTDYIMCMYLHLRHIKSLVRTYQRTIIYMILPVF